MMKDINHKINPLKWIIAIKVGYGNKQGFSHVGMDLEGLNGVIGRKKDPHVGFRTHWE